MGFEISGDPHPNVGGQTGTPARYFISHADPKAAPIWQPGIV